MTYLIISAIFLLVLLLMLAVGHTFEDAPDSVLGVDGHQSAAWYQWQAAKKISGVDMEFPYEAWQRGKVPGLIKPKRILP